MLLNLITFKLANSKHRFLLNHILIILFFAFTYYTLSNYIEGSMINNNSDDKNKPLSMYDSIHFSLVTQTTVGYGNIVPNHLITKIFNTLQLFTIYGILLIDF